MLKNEKYWNWNKMKRARMMKFERGKKTKKLRMEEKFEDCKTGMLKESELKQKTNRKQTKCFCLQKPKQCSHAGFGFCHCIQGTVTYQVPIQSLSANKHFVVT